MRFAMILMPLSLLLMVGCRAGLGEACDGADTCALGLYCDMEREVCDDRGKLLKKGAAETYVYPIPTNTAPGAGQPIPVPQTATQKKTEERKPSGQP